jgi:DNA-binding response OmpR family regulator
MDPIRVAIVEDDSFLAGMNEQKLTLEKMVPLLAYDGEAGLALVRKEKPDIVLLDIMMPKMDGWEVLQALRAAPETKSIPVIMLTNLGQKEDVDLALKYGANDYLIKAHFNPQEVVDRVRKMVAQHA